MSAKEKPVQKAKRESYDPAQDVLLAGKVTTENVLREFDYLFNGDRGATIMFLLNTTCRSLTDHNTNLADPYDPVLIWYRHATKLRQRANAKGKSAEYKKSAGLFVIPTIHNKQQRNDEYREILE